MKRWLEDLTEHTTILPDSVLNLELRAQSRGSNVQQLEVSVNISLQLMLT